MSPTTLLWLGASDPDTVRTVRLLEQAGWLVRLASTDTAASSALSDDSFGVVLIDADAPHGACWKVLRTLLQSGYSAPILMMADPKDLSSRVRALEAGCAELISKPVAGADLAQRLRAVLRSHLFASFVNHAVRGETCELDAASTSVQDLIAGFSKTAITGRVELVSAVASAASERAGALSFVRGQLVAASYAGAEGLQALLLAHLLAPLRFAMMNGEAPAVVELHQPVSEILSELDGLLSSWSRLSSALPAVARYVAVDAQDAAFVATTHADALLRASVANGTETLFTLLAQSKGRLIGLAEDFAQLHAHGLLRSSASPLGEAATATVPIVADETRAFGAVRVTQNTMAAVRPRRSEAPLRVNTLAPPSSVSGSAWLSPSVAPHSNPLPLRDEPLPPVPPASSAAMMVLTEDLSSVHDLSLLDVPNDPVIDPPAVITEGPVPPVPTNSVAVRALVENAEAEAQRVAKLFGDAMLSVAPSPAAPASPGTHRRSGRVVAAVFAALLLTVAGGLVIARRGVRGAAEVDPALLDAGLGEPASLAVSGTYARAERQHTGATEPSTDPAQPDAQAPAAVPLPMQASAAVAALTPNASAASRPSTDEPPLLTRKQLETALDRSQFKRVIEQGERVVAANPKDGEVWALIGVAYQASGQGAKSKEAYANCAKFATGQTKAECVRYAK